jgi:APA family basic amino acid/polyamine antiporter
MMAALPLDTWIRLIVWLIIGMIIYFTYGRHHSRVQRGTASVTVGAKSGD